MRYWLDDQKERWPEDRSPFLVLAAAGVLPKCCHILGQPLIQSKRERKNRRTFVPGVHFEFFVPDFGQNFEKKFGNAHPL